MDAKQVWRAALGELQVSLSPANYETWLRETNLVDVDDNRFKIGVPNGFAKDWLETRYRSLIAGTLARTQDYQRHQRKECLADALIFLTAAKAGLPVLTANRDEFDLIQQLAPRGRFIHF